MTVCIAAMCQYQNKPYIAGGADKLLTSGDIEFQAQQSKVGSLTRSIAVLTAGDVDPHTYAISNTRRHFILCANPEVEKVAHFYAAHLNKFRREFAGAQSFGDLGLTVESFIDRQGAMVPSIASELHMKFQGNWKYCEAIVCGTDILGAHVYAIDNMGGVTSKNGVGFASIGSGARHAQSQFMFAQHSHSSTLVDTLFLVHRSKKFSQVAPGVGPDTDLFFVGQGEGFSFFNEDTKAILNVTYEKYSEGVVAAEKEARETTSHVLQSLWSSQAGSR